MRTVEQTLSLIKELSETNYNGADYTRYLEQELRTAIEELAADAARYRTVLGMSSDALLRLYNTRFDLRQQVIDAAKEST